MTSFHIGPFGCPARGGLESFCDHILTSVRVMHRTGTIGCVNVARSELLLVSRQNKLRALYNNK